jgi:hypothetical protein
MVTARERPAKEDHGTEGGHDEPNAQGYGELAGQRIGNAKTRRDVDEGNSERFFKYAHGGKSSLNLIMIINYIYGDVSSRPGMKEAAPVNGTRPPLATSTNA